MENEQNKTMINLTRENTGEFKAASVIDLYVPPCLIVTGTVCNVLVVMVMQSRFFRTVSTSFYMSVNAVVDIASLDIALPAHWLYVNFPWIFQRTDYSHYMCKFFNFFGWGSSDLGIILTVAMTTERAIAITFPLKAGTLCSKGRAKIVIIILFIIIVLKEIHFLLKSVIVPEGQTNQLCYVDLSNSEYEYFWTSVWPWIHNIFLLLSFVIIMFSNVVILRNVRKSNKGNTKGVCQKSVRNTARLESRGRQLSIMLIIDSFTIIACTLPFSLIVTISSSTPLFDDSPQQQGLSKLLFAISFYLLYINRCANFYLYCMSGSRFRLALRQTVGCHGSRRRKQNVRTTFQSSAHDSETRSSNDTTLSSVAASQQQQSLHI